MKQLIVLVATVVLGISLAGSVFGMGNGVKELTNQVDSAITSTFITEGTGGAKSLNMDGFTNNPYK